ncbi:thioesterase family protein [Rhodococcus sp. CC-R104]|uniref:Thioesterase family protein n=1 Tax=Rhodococcus chondri TaxID=3065941 RepID=A0ABU7JR24_9NOCA|nr:thioesterase family protein [Rhodococcus sp. CC-R104]MEE2032473.1 thioesterase family protein [Rhodococcus sp. CC-R104]
MRVEHFRPTRHTVSTWGDDLQHGAPPSALLTRALERHTPRPGTRLTRITIDLLGPVPLTDIEVRSWIDRPGRKIELVVAELWATAPDGTRRAVARGTAWRLETVDLPDVARTSEPPLTPVAETERTDMAGVFSSFTGYIDTLDWRIVVPFGVPGPSAAWLRTDVALVEGETPTVVERLFTVADVANGIGSKLDPRHWLFLNTDLTVHLFRAPDSDWTGIAAETSVGPDGVGMTTGVLYDETGPLGRITQNVQVRPR